MGLMRLLGLENGFKVKVIGRTKDNEPVVAIEFFGDKSDIIYRYQEVIDAMEKVVKRYDKTPKNEYEVIIKRK